MLSNLALKIKHLRATDLLQQAIKLLTYTDSILIKSREILIFKYSRVY